MAHYDKIMINQSYGLYDTYVTQFYFLKSNDLQMSNVYNTYLKTI